MVPSAYPRTSVAAAPHGAQVHGSCPAIWSTQKGPDVVTCTWLPGWCSLSPALRRPCGLPGDSTLACITNEELVAQNRNMATPTPSQTCLSWAEQPIPILALGQRRHLALPGNVHLRDFNCISESAPGSPRWVKSLVLVSFTWGPRYDPPSYLGPPIRSRGLFWKDRWV